MQNIENLIDQGNYCLDQKNPQQALLYFNTAVLASPSNIQALTSCAEILIHLNRPEEALVYLQQALQFNPDCNLLILHATTLYQIGKYTEAIECFKYVIHAEPHNHGVAWNNLGAALESIENTLEAKNAYKQAILLNSQHAEAQNNLGAIYSKEGKFDKARKHFEAAILAKPDFIEAHYNLSLIKTYTIDDPHLSFLEKIMPNIHTHSIFTRIHYYFALGKALDDTQQYAHAFQAYAAGNNLHYQQQPWCSNKLRTTIAQLPHIFTKKFLTNSKQTQEKRCPIFIVGMPRSGTTLVEQILSSHANIYGAGELSILDEVIQQAYQLTNMPFDQWVTQLTDQEFTNLGEQYLTKTWSLAPDKDFIIDKMPSNCFYIGMIYRMLPTAKIIHTQRDPMDSCFSCFTHLFKDNMAFAYDLLSLGNYYLLYAQAMHYWDNILPVNTIFNLHYEQLINNHTEISKQLVDYIGLPWDENCLNFYTNKRIVKTASFTQVRKPIYKTSIQRWRHFSNELKPLSQIIATFHNDLGALLLQQQEFHQAMQYLPSAVTLAPNFAEAHCNLGLTLLGLSKHTDAFLHLKKALQLKSNYAEAYYGIAKIYLHQHDFSAAVESIRKAIAINSQYVEFYQLLATIYQEQGDYKQALIYLDQALVIHPTNTMSTLNKGNILMEIGELAKAEEIFLQITSHPTIETRILAHYCLVQLNKIQLNHPSVHALLSILANNQHDISPNKLIYAYFALGKCYDDLNEWDKAFEYFSQGCKLKRSRIDYDITEQVQFTTQLIENFTYQTIEELRNYANASSQPIFIVGMPRSGSTLVEQILSSHHQVSTAGELKYLNNFIQYPIQSSQLQNLASNYLDYLKLFAPQTKHITDKMPYNFMSIGVIHALFPNAKIIHIQRNPIDTCLSCYTKLFTHGQLYSYDLTELGKYYNCYTNIMNHWRNILPSNSWLDINYEDLVDNFEYEARKIIAYCDLDWDSNCLNFHQSKRQIRTASFAQVRKPIYHSSIKRWHNYEHNLTALIQVLTSPNNTHDQISA